MNYAKSFILENLKFFKISLNRYHPIEEVLTVNEDVQEHNKGEE